MTPLHKSYQTRSAAETQQLAHELIEHIFYTKKVLLSGNLGSGKTTFVKGLADALGISSAITSPTYTYLNQYPIPNHQQELSTLYHFDLYRLPEQDEHPENTRASIGLEDAFQDPQGLVIVEWPERLGLSGGLQISCASENDHHLITVKELKED